MKYVVSRRGVMAGALLAPAALAADNDKASGTLSGVVVSAKEYWVEKNKNVKLWAYRKRGSEKPKGVLLMVHGSSNSSRSSFDLNVPALRDGRYSLMNAFAELGYDCWTFDHENYGLSSRTESNSDISSGVEDLKAVVEFVAKETGTAKVHLFGESSGAIRAGAFAQARPERVNRLVLGAFTYTGKGSPTLTERAKNIAAYRASNRRLRDREMIRSIFTRDRPGTTDPAVAEALADAELKYGDQIPTGTYLDMSANLPLVDPKKVLAPVLMIRGEYDGISTMEDLMDFYGQLPTGDRQFVVLPGVAHNLILSTNRRLFWHAMHSFLATPDAIAVG